MNLHTVICKGGVITRWGQSVVIPLYEDNFIRTVYSKQKNFGTPRR